MTVHFLLPHHFAKLALFSQTKSAQIMKISTTQLEEEEDQLAKTRCRMCGGGGWVVDEAGMLDQDTARALATGKAAAKGGAKVWPGASPCEQARRGYR